MKTYTKEELTEVLRLHKMWLNDENNGVRADLSYADLSYADLSYADLRSADLSYADLSYADLSYADLSYADLSYADLRSANLSSADLRSADLRSADLSSADLRSADLRSADLSSADLRSADLRSADLRSADLSSADLRSADLSKSMNLLNAAAWVVENFKTSKDGYIVYKCFNGTYSPPQYWKIEAGSYITEEVNSCRSDECGCGINFATLEWVKREHSNKDIWKCLIEWKDACSIVVPYNTDGKARCGRVKLLKIVK